MFTVSKRRSFLISMLAQVSIPLIAAAESSAPSCRTTPVHDLRVHIVNEARASKSTLDAALAEVGEIWGRVGLQFTWTVPPALPQPADRRSLIVVIRRNLKPMLSMDVASTKTRVRVPLGWLVFDSEGRQGNLIEVSFEETMALVHRGVQTDRPLTALPWLARDHAIGRGLGRVIAHEIGHWLMGRGHVELGLMKSRFDAKDLVELSSPALPKTWVAVSQAGSTCVPLAVHRLTAG